MIGYILALSLSAVIVAAATFMTYSTIEEKKADAAEIAAETLARKISTVISNVWEIKQNYPNAKYSTVLDIPSTLGGLSYYVELCNQAVYVNTTNGKVHVKNPLYSNVSERLSIDLNGKVYGSERVLNISCDKFDYLYKFDFCADDSLGLSGYTRITDFSDENPDWHLDSCSYRTPIKVTNPTGLDLDGYQLLVVLKDSNFDYFQANSNASDLRFFYGSKELDYWIERWNPDDTYTSRIWVELPDPPFSPGADAEFYIYMYYGNNHSAEPKSDGSETFDFFDDFNTGETLPKTDNWDFDNDGDVYIIENEKLVIENGAYVKSNVEVGSMPCVIEARVGAVKKEASMFFRNDGLEGSNAPYTSGYLFSSANLSTPDDSRNLAIIEDNNDFRNSSNNPVDQRWNRLRCILNGGDIVVCRYFYDNFTVDGSLTWLSPAVDGFFGLCTTQPDTMGYFDWIFVRKFAAVTTVDVSTREEAVPTAYICGSQSENYTWEDISKVSSVENGGQIEGNNFICNKSTDSATFKIMNLEDQEYSITLTVGDEHGANNPDKLVQNMIVTINDEPPRHIDCTSSNPCKNEWWSAIKPDSNGDLKITFKDDDGDYYWAVRSLTLEQGERVIKMVRGE